ncbi:MAG: uracil-DNA glycosylase [Acidimicrobiales bacterium]
MVTGSLSLPGGGPLASVTADVVACAACPRLVAWREEAAARPRASYAGQEYWGRPVPGFGDPEARVLLVGLAPAAHGGNRTGRVFTGDRSGDFLFAALWRAGLANQPESVSSGDGLELRGAYVTAAVRCAPPANKPTPGERDRCLPYLGRELLALERARAVVVLGRFAYDAVCRLTDMRSRPAFGHGAEAPLEPSASPTGRRFALLAERGTTVVCSYHPSQQNTFTGRLTEAMLDSVMARAIEIAT